MLVPSEADAVFEGGGVKGIAFAGAIRAAEDAGVERWVNVAGTSAGAIAACLLAVGYHAPDLERILVTDYRRFPDYGRGGVARGLLGSLVRRGLAPGRYFEHWLDGWIARSPLARELGRLRLVFSDVERRDLPDGVDPAVARRARYRLRVIASDVTSGRMLVLPDDIRRFRRPDGAPREPGDLGLVEAVRMSMSLPFLFTPVVLETERGRHYVVDGGVLSNFPVWLFDTVGRPPARPTWGFRLHGGTDAVEADPHRRIPLPFWRLKLGEALFRASSEAWDREHVARVQAVRTVGIPTGTIGTAEFGLGSDRAEWLRSSGETHARAFFESPETGRYVEQFLTVGDLSPVRTPVSRERS